MEFLISHWCCILPIVAIIVVIIGVSVFLKNNNSKDSTQSDNNPSNIKSNM